ncbi:MAG: hypothetical protein AAF456_23130, partial [Planctomycetota bacterium]
LLQTNPDLSCFAGVSGVFSSLEPPNRAFEGLTDATRDHPHLWPEIQGSLPPGKSKKFSDLFLERGAALIKGPTHGSNLAIVFTQMPESTDRLPG